jgi:aspartyl-tRNA(Asn)/glutamyl-tRNA(Gln) amidotransferase subunit B
VSALDTAAALPDQTLAGWEPVIGLEVHAQLLTASKMFCRCSTAYLAVEPNTNVCPVCLGLPGVLPVINRRAVEMTVLTGLALSCRIPPESKFDRKNYFYPDLPKGYQISQYDQPLCVEGHLNVVSAGAERLVGITRVHLEEDTGKLVHGGDSLHLGAGSLVDLNRAGVPLMEIVSEPDMRTSDEARQYMEALRDLLRWIGVCDGNMEEGSLRCDANVSVRRRGHEGFGVKTEIKNMNSFRSVQRAIEFEVRRQVALLEEGGEIVQETRGWVDAEGRTVGQRSKEYAHDYRYFPEPDLPPLSIDPAWVEEQRASLPELPAARRARLKSQYALGEQEAALLTQERTWADYFEAAAASAEARQVANWMLGDLASRVKDLDRGLAQSPMPAEHLASLVRLLTDGTISGKMAKELFADAYESGRDPAEIATERGLRQVTDESELVMAVESALAANPKAVSDYRGGNLRALGAIVGAVMRETGGRGNPETVNRLLRERLDQLGG